MCGFSKTEILLLMILALQLLQIGLKIGEIING